jgi:hypothetical protein
MAGLARLAPARLPGSANVSRSFPTVGPVVVGTMVAGVVGAALLTRPGNLRGASAPGRRSPGAERTNVTAARRLNRASGVLAGSVLADSGIEHYRGSFHNKAMFAPLIASTLSIAAGTHGLGDRRQGSHPARDAVYALAGAVGLIGTGFHVYNVDKRPGGFSWLNLFYGAPLGAPAALLLSGMFGFLAERVRDAPDGDEPSLVGVPAERAVAAATAVALLGTMGEAALLHFRGSFHNPAMLFPVTVPPVAAGLLAVLALRPDLSPETLTRWWLRLTAAMGFAGAGFHLYGVSRNMGGWRNWSQNVLNGPPIPAPPSFTGLALAGLAALELAAERKQAHG